MKVWDMAIKGFAIPPTVNYLSTNIKQSDRRSFNHTIPGIIESLQTVSANRIRIAFNHVNDKKASGIGHEDAVNKTSIELVQAAEAHCRVLLVQFSYEQILAETKNYSKSLGDILNALVELYAVDTCLHSLNNLLLVNTIINYVYCDSNMIYFINMI